MKNLILALTLFITAPLAFAGDAPKQMENEDGGVFAYSCRLDGEMNGVRLGLGFSAQVMGGRGMIRCIDKRHGDVREVNVPVRITVLGAGPGADLSVVKHVRVTTGGLGLVHNPKDLTGHFSLAGSAGVTLIDRGYGVQSAVSVKRHGHGVSFEMGFMGEEAYGLGARLHGMVMFVNPIRH